MRLPIQNTPLHTRGMRLPIQIHHYHDYRLEAYGWVVVNFGGGNYFGSRMWG